MNVGSLFSGIGGFDLGLERAGMRTAWFCEQDAYCQRVLAKHWPGVPCYPDITELRGCDVEPVAVLVGGFPCQDISAAGKGAGLAGARSGLWSEYARLVGELRPRYVIVENVPMLRTRGLDQVLQDLDACGYDAEWDGISASAVGAPHRRDRIWIIAYPRSARRREVAGGTYADEGADGRRSQDDYEPGRTSSQRLRAGERRTGLADTELSGLEGHRADAGQLQVAEPRDSRPLADAAGEPERESADEADALAASWNARQESGRGGWWFAEPDVGRVANGVPARMDRLRALGNALVPQIAEWIGQRIVSYENSLLGGREG